jgi:hypothetical protein
MSLLVLLLSWENLGTGKDIRVEGEVALYDRKRRGYVSLNGEKGKEGPKAVNPHLSTRLQHRICRGGQRT